MYKSNQIQRVVNHLHYIDNKIKLKINLNQLEVHLQDYQYNLVITIKERIEFKHILLNYHITTYPPSGDITLNPFTNPIMRIKVKFIPSLT